MKLLEGVIDADRAFADEEHDNDMREQIADLQRQLRETRHELLTIRRESAQALGNLRKLLKPWYQALQMIYGELDAAGIEDTATETSATSSPRTTAIWESWKTRLPGGPAKIIDALRLQPDMNTQQLAIATGVHRNSIPAMIYRLNKAGLLNKNGGRFSLKAL